MSSINSVHSNVPYTPPVPPPASAKVAAAQPPSTQAAAAGSATSVVATQPPAAQAAAAATAASYRNAAGDTVNLSGIVLKDRDGDGGVGLPATKPPVPESSVQQKVEIAYSANQPAKS